MDNMDPNIQSEQNYTHSVMYLPTLVKRLPPSMQPQSYEDPTPQHHPNQAINTAQTINVEDSNGSPIPMTTEQTNDPINKHQHDEMLEQLMILVQRTQNADSMVQVNRDVYQNFVIQLQTRSRMISSIHHAENSPQFVVPNFDLERAKRDLKVIENVLRQKAIELNNIRKSLIKAHCEIFDQLLEIQNKTLHEHLPQWHHEQQLINNGAQSETISLDKIQLWVEKIVDIIWRIKNQIKGLQLTLTDKPNVPFDTEDLDRFVICVNKALETLILSAFVVEKQPPQVMKTNTRFTATVRFLCGNKLNVQLINPTVKAIILSEANARTVIRYHKQLIDQSWAPVESFHNQQQMSENQLRAQSAIGHQHHAALSTNQGVILSPAHTLTPNPQSVPMDQQHMAFGTTNHPSSIETSVDQKQPMSLVDHHHGHSRHQQQHQHHPQFFQQSQQQQHHAISSHSTINSNQQQQFSGLTEIGYNPDVPVSSKDFESSGEILNNSNILEFQEQTGHMISHFRNMQLKKIKRTEKKGTESVMDEKFVLMFFTEFRLADNSFYNYSQKTSSATSRVKRGDLLFHILAFSLPVVVIVHGNQDPHAWATVTWHNAFARPDELLYHVPDKVPWRELGHVLSEKFRSFSGRGLSQQNLKYLAGKVYRNVVDDDEILISWNQFAKESLADRSFTFWEWFYSILKLTKEHLRDLWRADRIWGFIGKKGCVDLMLGSAYNEPSPVGTFLLRYSETELGGITIAWVSETSEMDDAMSPSLSDRVQIVSKRHSPTNNSSHVIMHLQPDLASDLKMRPLADRLRDLKDLVYLYSNIPKDEAFQQFYSPLPPMRSADDRPYVESMLVATIAAKYNKSVAMDRTNISSPHSNTSNQDQVTVSSVVSHVSNSQCSPESYYHENIAMNDVMDTNFASYDGVGTGDFNYPIQ